MSTTSALSITRTKARPRVVGGIVPRNGAPEPLPRDLFSFEGVSALIVAGFAGSRLFDDERQADVEAWVERLVRGADRPLGLGLTIAIVDPPADRVLWRARVIALGGYPPATRDQLQREAVSGWPGAGNDAVTLGCARALAPASIGSADLEARGAAAAPYRSFRRRLGLHDFERAVAPVRGGDGAVVMVQVDAVQEGVEIDAQVRPAIGALTPALATAYASRFLVIRAARERLLARLSDRQRDVVPFLVEGMSEPAIARALGRSVHTVHDHTKRIYRKLGVRSRLALRDLWFGHEPGGR